MEDKLGKEYEPYIFAALNSAKVMLVVGTEPDRFKAVWVKNEWSRYLALISRDSTRVLIPCYKGISAYDLPKEFNRLQSQDMAKIGALQDLVRGVGKIVSPSAAGEKIQNANNYTNAKDDIDPLLKRAFLVLEDEDWEKADSILEQVLNIDPENPNAYLGKLLVEKQVKTLNDLQNSSTSFINSANYEKACRFADEELRNKLEEIKNNNLEHVYQEACGEMETAKTSDDYQRLVNQFSSLGKYKNSEDLKSECSIKTTAIRKQEKKKSRMKKTGFVLSVILLIALGIGGVKYYQYNQEAPLLKKYNDATQLMANGEYLEAKAIFEEIPEYKDSNALITECDYLNACKLYEDGVYYTAKLRFNSLGDYKDSKEKYALCMKELELDTSTKPDYFTVNGIRP